VIRDDNRGSAGLHGLHGIVGADDTLDDDGQLRDRTEPCDIRPGENGIDERSEVQRERRLTELLRYVLELACGEIHRFQARRELEGVAHVALAATKPRRSDREHERRATRGAVTVSTSAEQPAASARRTSAVVAARSLYT